MPSPTRKMDSFRGSRRTGKPPRSSRCRRASPLRPIFGGGATAAYWQRRQEEELGAGEWVLTIWKPVADLAEYWATLRELGAAAAEAGDLPSQRTPVRLVSRGDERLQILSQLCREAVRPRWVGAGDLRLPNAGEGVVILPVSPSDDVETTGGTEEDNVEVEGDGGTTGRFEIYKGFRGDFHWRLVTDSGKSLASSDGGYRSESDCLAAIGLLRLHTRDARLQLSKDAPEGPPRQKRKTRSRKRSPTSAPA